ncbi:MAG TPA: vanadium-dependent haloperoxidase [Gemmatimonadaceae bacterium]|nr:vanadium-dependent haloperoxidase [Gemmatimonadaceae bacterium]
MLALVLAACSDPATAPPAVSRGGLDGLAAQKVSDFAASPSSIGWQAEGRALIAANNLSALAAARVLAALSIAQYQAVSAIPDVDGGEALPANGVGAGGRSELEAHRGAVAGASARVLSFLFPAAAGSLSQRAAAEGEAGPGNVHPHFARGLAVGELAGAAMVEHLKTDRFNAPWTGTVPVGPGMWIANGPPAGVTFGGVRPHLLTSGAQFRPSSPPAFNSPAFLADVAEIRSLSDTRSPAQAAMAVAWNYGGGTFTPPGYWNLTAASYVDTFGLNERAATRAFALTSTAMMDALIGCWDAKYYYWTLRPTQADGLITLTFGLPNHPSYPSGHSCVSSAAATVLKEIFPERGAELDAWVEEAGLSRMYAGIHYRFDITAGQDLGQAVARWVIANADRLE